MIRNRNIALVVIMFVLLAMTFLVQNHDVSPVSKDNPTKVLFAFLSVGNKAERNQILHDNYEVVRKLKSQSYTFECMIFVYAAARNIPDWVAKAGNNTEFPCTIRVMYKMGFVHWLKYLNPTLLKKGRFDYVSILLDDVALGPPHGNVDFLDYFDIIKRHGISFASPAIVGSWHGPLHPAKMKPNQIGRYMDMVEIQSCTYRIDAWSCFYELADSEFPSGWGMDVWYYDYCAKRPNLGKLAIIDKYKSVHNPQQLPTTNTGDPDQGSYWGAQVRTWKELRGVTLSEHWPKAIGEIFDYGSK
jgi:hypothetical protein